MAAWDNSADNPYNPNPAEEVRFGKPTTAEMMVGWVILSDAEPGVTVPGGVLTSRTRVAD